MSKEELDDLLELVKALVVNEQTDHIGDAVRLSLLKDECVDKWCK